MEARGGRPLGRREAWKEGRENDGDIIGEAKLVQIGNSVRWGGRGRNFSPQSATDTGDSLREDESQKKESVRNGGLGKKRV